MEGSLDRKCCRCRKHKHSGEFTEPNRLCNTCIAYKKEYYQHKKNGTDKNKEPKVKFEQKMHLCEICSNPIRLCQKTQREETSYHKDRLRRLENPEEYENEEKSE